MITHLQSTTKARAGQQDPLMGSVVLQRKCQKCGKKKKALQRAAIRPAPYSVPPIVQEVLRSPGQPLDPATRSFMEPPFGHDFSHVQVHTDSKASQSARSINADAYTAGHDIVFDAIRFAPGTQERQRLIAHELAHVVQQSQNVISRMQPVFVGNEQGSAEMEANSVADRIIDGKSGGTISVQPAQLLHRKVKVDKPKDKIANPTGKGLVQTNAETVEGYLRTLCSDGSVSVDKGSGSVSLAAAFCPTPMTAGFSGPPTPAPADKSKEPTGCICLCDMVGSANDYTILVDDKDWPHTSGKVVTTPSPNSPKLWGAATVSGKAMTIDPWLVLGHEFCGHAWLAEKGLPDTNATRGEGGHQETVARENELRKEHGIEARGSFKDPYCGESFFQDKAGPGPVEWSSYLKKCETWRKKTYGGKYKISDKIP